jgi:hypothetical protein
VVPEVSTISLIVGENIDGAGVSVEYHLGDNVVEVVADFLQVAFQTGAVFALQDDRVYIASRTSAQ